MVFLTMQNLCKKDSGISSAYSTLLYDVSCPSWGSSTESCVQPSSMSEGVSLKMGVHQQHFLNTKQPNFQLQDAESSSTQSTGQSCSKEDSMKDGRPNGQSIVSAPSGVNKTHGKPMGGHAKFASSMGPQDFVFAPYVDYNQSVAPVPLQLCYAEPYYGGILTPFYGPQTMQIQQSQMMGMTPARVPLPLNLTEDEPIFVNAKQYRAILRRRHYRAKLEAGNKLIQGRKPYLHESRHKHAMNRARGSGGRFLNVKKLNESKSITTSDVREVSGSAELHLTGNMSEPEVNPKSYKDAASTTCCSDITNAPNGEDIFQQPEFRFSGYPPHNGRTIQSCSAGTCTGSCLLSTDEVVNIGHHSSSDSAFRNVENAAATIPLGSHPWLC